MNFKFKIGTKVFFGKECVKENKAVFKDFGKELCWLRERTPQRQAELFRTSLRYLKSMALIMRFMTEWQTILLLKMSKREGKRQENLMPILSSESEEARLWTLRRR